MSLFDVLRSALPVSDLPPPEQIPFTTDEQRNQRLAQLADSNRGEAVGRVCAMARQGWDVLPEKPGKWIGDFIQNHPAATSVYGSVLKNDEVDAAEHGMVPDVLNSLVKHNQTSLIKQWGRERGFNALSKYEFKMLVAGALDQDQDPLIDSDMFEALLDHTELDRRAHFALNALLSSPNLDVLGQNPDIASTIVKSLTNNGLYSRHSLYSPDEIDEPSVLLHVIAPLENCVHGGREERVAALLDVARLLVELTKSRPQTERGRGFLFEQLHSIPVGKNNVRHEDMLKQALRKFVRVLFNRRCLPDQKTLSDWKHDTPEFFECIAEGSVVVCGRWLLPRLPTTL